MVQWQKDWRGFWLWFQGLDSLPGVKGEKGILGFPGPRVSGLPSLQNLDCVWLTAWLTADVELAGHEMFSLWLYLMVTFPWCHRDFLVMMGCRATKVLKWVKFKFCSTSLSDFFCVLIVKAFVFQGIQGSPGLPGLIGREGQKVSPHVNYAKHHNDLLFLHQNLLRLCWWLSVRFVWYSLFEQQGPEITVKQSLSARVFLWWSHVKLWF